MADSSRQRRGQQVSRKRVARAWPTRAIPVLVLVVSVLLVVARVPSAVAAVHVSSGYTPKTGSSERTAILDAARKYLGFEGKFVVHVMTVSGRYASAYIEAAPAGSSEPAFLCFEWVGGACTCSGVDSVAADTDIQRSLDSKPHAPAKGSAERTAILDAARRYLHYTGKFVVHQMTVCGTVASVDIEGENGSPSRVSLAFEHHEPEPWKCTGPDTPAASSSSYSAASIFTPPPALQEPDWNSFLWLLTNDAYLTASSPPPNFSPFVPLPTYGSLFSPTPYSTFGYGVHGDLNSDGRYIWPEVPYGAHPSPYWTGANTVWNWVPSYSRFDGTYVSGYWRRTR